MNIILQKNLVRWHRVVIGIPRAGLALFNICTGNSYIRSRRVNPVTDENVALIDPADSYWFWSFLVASSLLPFRPFTFSPFFFILLSFSLLSNSCLLIGSLSLFFPFYFPVWIPQSICLAITVTTSISLTLRAWGQARDSHQTNAALTQ